MSNSSIHNLLGLTSLHTRQVIGFLQHVAEKSDAATWPPNGRASKLYVEPSVWLAGRTPSESPDLERQKEKESNKGGKSSVEAHVRSSMSWHQVLDGPCSRIALIGDPGDGKTLASRATVARICVDSAARLAQRTMAASDVRFAFWLPATVWINADIPADEQMENSSGGGSVVSGLLDALGAKLEPGLRQWIGRRLQEGPGALVVIDGLDEVEKSKTKILRDRLWKLNEERSTLGRLVATCRTADWNELRHLLPWIKEGDVFKLAGLDHPASRGRFALKYLGDEKKVISLLAGLRENSALEDACRNPLILSFVCILYHTGKLDPSNTVASVYNQILISYLRGEWRDKSLATSSFPWSSNSEETRYESEKRFLSRMAWELFRVENCDGPNRFTLVNWENAFKTAASDLRPDLPGKQMATTAEAFLAHLRDLGLLIPGRAVKGEATWSCSHRSFLEFLAAWWIGHEWEIMARSRGPEAGENPLEWLLQVKKPFQFEPAWEPLLCFTAGILQENGAPMMLEALENEPDNLFRTVFGLQCKLIAHAPEIEFWPVHLAKRWGHWTEVPEMDHTRREFEDPGEFGLFSKKWRQVALWKRNFTGLWISYGKDLAQSENAWKYISTGIHDAVSARPDSLAEKLRRFHELQGIVFWDLIFMLLNDKYRFAVGSRVNARRTRAIEALRSLGVGNDARRHLENALIPWRDGPRSWQDEEMGRLSWDRDLRGKAARALGELGDRESRTKLETVFLDVLPEEVNNLWLPGEILRALGDLGDSDSRGFLIDQFEASLERTRAISDEHQRWLEAGLRQYAIMALAKLPDHPDIEAILERLLDPSEVATEPTEPGIFVRRYAAEALRERGRLKDDLGSLLRRLSHPDPGIRRNAAHALGRLRDPRSRESLEASLSNDPDIWVCHDAAEALGRLGMAESVPTLRRALETTTNYLDETPTAILHALIAIDSDSARHALEELLPGLLDRTIPAILLPDDLIQQVIEAIGRLGGKTSRPFLKNLLEIQNQHRGTLIRVLGELEDSASDRSWFEDIAKFGLIRKPGYGNDRSPECASKFFAFIEQLTRPFRAWWSSNLAARGFLGEDYLRSAAVTALGKIGAIESVPVILRHFRRAEDEGLRDRAAGEALWSIVRANPKSFRPGGKYAREIQIREGMLDRTMRAFRRRRTAFLQTLWPEAAIMFVVIPLISGAIGGSNAALAAFLAPVALLALLILLGLVREWSERQATQSARNDAGENPPDTPSSADT